MRSAGAESEAPPCHLLARNLGSVRRVGSPTVGLAPGQTEAVDVFARRLQATQWRSHPLYVPSRSTFVNSPDWNVLDAPASSLCSHGKVWKSERLLVHPRLGRVDTDDPDTYRRLDATLRRYRTGQPERGSRCIEVWAYCRGRLGCLCDRFGNQWATPLSRVTRLRRGREVHQRGASTND